MGWPARLSEMRRSTEEQYDRRPGTPAREKLLCLLIAFLAGCSSSPVPIAPSQSLAGTPTAGTYWPTDVWRTSSPEEQGMDSQMLAKMLAAVQEQRLNLHSLLVIRNGALVSESYFGPYYQDTRHESYSVTKSFVSTLVGIAIDQGDIGGTEQQVVDFFPDRAIADLGRLKEGMTLEDVLTMRSGLRWEEGDAAIRALYSSPDWVQAVLDKPMARPPGSRFNYCSGCSHLLSAIVQQATGMNTRDFAERTLFNPLGISNISWDTDPAGIPIGGWGLQITPRDMAKLGYLYLKGGQWDGRQIVSARWVETATREHTDTNGDLGYGYHWWTYPSPAAFAALGLYGQMIFVVPGADLIVVTTAEVDSHDEIFRLIEQYILPAVVETQE